MVYMGLTTVWFDILCSQGGPSWFLYLYEVAWILRYLLATLALRFYIVTAHLFSLCYNCIFAFDYISWIGMLSWEVSWYLLCVVVTFGMPWLP